MCQSHTIDGVQGLHYMLSGFQPLCFYALFSIALSGTIWIFKPSEYNRKESATLSLFSENEIFIGILFTKGQIKTEDCASPR